MDLQTGWYFPSAAAAAADVVGVGMNMAPSSSTSYAVGVGFAVDAIVVVEPSRPSACWMVELCHLI